MNKYLLMAIVAVLALVLVMGLTACSGKAEVRDPSQTAAGVAYKKISAQEAKSLIDQGNLILLDTRTQAEFDAGHIPGAILLPEYEIAQKAATLLPDKDAKILVYCRSGRRSAIAAKELLAMGYTDVSDFGCIIDWPYDIVT